MTLSTSDKKGIVGILGAIFFTSGVGLFVTVLDVGPTQAHLSIILASMVSALAIYIGAASLAYIIQKH